jgi:alpha-D-ribose 1-methylphosphonate 5-triphosphate synthase subunit PhnH
VTHSGTLASNRQNKASPKYNDDISLLISQYLIPAKHACYSTLLSVADNNEPSRRQIFLFKKNTVTWLQFHLVDILDKRAVYIYLQYIYKI